MAEEWLLTVEERRKVGDWEEELLRAQARKIVGWGAQRCDNHLHGIWIENTKVRGGDLCRECELCWAEFRKETGLDA